MGNRTALKASRISSALHTHKILQMGEYPNGSFLKTINPYYIFCIGSSIFLKREIKFKFFLDLHSKVAIVLIISSVPMNFLFTLLALIIGNKTFLFNWTFLFAYTLASLFLVDFLKSFHT